MKHNDQVQGTWGNVLSFPLQRIYYLEYPMLFIPRDMISENRKCDFVSTKKLLFSVDVSHCSLKTRISATSILLNGVR